MRRIPSITKEKKKNKFNNPINYLSVAQNPKSTMIN